MACILLFGRQLGCFWSVQSRRLVPHSRRQCDRHWRLIVDRVCVPVCSRWQHSETVADVRVNSQIDDGRSCLVVCVQPCFRAGALRRHENRPFSVIPDPFPPVVSSSSVVWYRRSVCVRVGIVRARVLVSRSKVLSLVLCCRLRSVAPRETVWCHYFNFKTVQTKTKDVSCSVILAGINSGVQKRWHVFYFLVGSWGVFGRFRVGGWYHTRGGSVTDTGV